MKKMYKMAGIACLGLLLSTQNSNAQTQSDFENLSLSPNSFWDGSDMSGTHNAGIFTSSFMDGTAIYNNVYDTSWGAAYAYWLVGFAYSNMTDTVTSGSGNVFSAKAGSGHGGSPNYAISQNYSMITLTGGASNNVVNGFHITNSTYAANSMRDGDAFAKQFGSPNDASGSPDGTNGEDWFLLTIKGYSAGNLTTDSVNFYLADYRFANNSQDYIVKDWQWVDLTSLGNIDSVYFQLSSSDVGAFGMNTPAFFCLDNFNDQTVSIDKLNEDLSFSIFPNPTKKQLNINLINDVKTLQIINVTGRVVRSINDFTTGTHSIDVGNLSAGVYFIKAISTNHTKIERFIKK